MNVKKTIPGAFLCATMLTGLLPAASAANAVSAAVTPQRTFTVDGVEKAAEIYTIQGENYFRLRDMAALLNGTAAQFSIDYDAAANAILIVTGEAYDVLDTDLAVNADHSASCVPSRQTFLVNGEPQTMSFYNLGGSNFFTLNDLSQLIGFTAEYDEETNTAAVSTKQKIRLGFTNDMMIVFGIAEDLGLWEQEFGNGYEVTATQVQNAPTFLSKVEAGEMEFGIFGDQALIQAYAQGKDITVVGSYADCSNNWMIVARKDSGIETASDLVGKNISFEEGTAAGKKWDIILEVEEISKDEVNIIGLSSIPDQIKAMEEGTVDAFLTNTIYLPEVEALGGYVVAPYSDFGVDVSAMGVGTEFAENNPELVAKIIRVFAAEAEWTTTHREEAIQYISTLGNYTIEEATVVYDAKDRYVGYNEEIEQAFNETALFLYQNELVDRLVTADEFVDTLYLTLADLM